MKDIFVTLLFCANHRVCFKSQTVSIPSLLWEGKDHDKISIKFFFLFNGPEHVFFFFSNLDLLEYPSIEESIEGIIKTRDIKAVCIRWSVCSFSFLYIWDLIIQLSCVQYYCFSVGFQCPLYHCFLPRVAEHYEGVAVTSFKERKDVNFYYGCCEVILNTV